MANDFIIMLTAIAFILNLFSKKIIAKYKKLIPKKI